MREIEVWIWTLDPSLIHRNWFNNIVAKYVFRLNTAPDPTTCVNRPTSLIRCGPSLSIGLWKSPKSTAWRRRLCILPYLTSTVSSATWPSCAPSCNWSAPLPCSLHRKSKINLRLIHIRSAMEGETYRFTFYLSEKEKMSSRSFRIIFEFSKCICYRKYEEIYPPDLREFVYITDETYTKHQVLRMEHLILKVLSFDLSTPTPLAFISLFCISNGLTERTRYLAMV